MRLSFKIALAVVVIVTLSVSVGGYALILSDFHGQLSQRVEQAADETQMLCTALGTLALRRAGMDQDIESALRKEMQEETFARDRQLTLLKGENAPAEGLTYRIHRDGSSRVTLTVDARFSVAEQTFCLESRTDVSESYALRRQNLRTYRMILLLAVCTSVVAGLLLSRYFTGPIRKLSRSTERFAAGQYDCRARVSTGDEIGALAQRFNAMADELQEHMTELERTARQQREFTASFAHELKTPLTSIIGYADTMRSRKLPEAQQIEAASFIFSEGKRLERLSRSLLQLFALEGEPPRLCPVRAEVLACNVRRSTSFALSGKHILLQERVKPAVVMGESALLETLLVNLVDNARKASPEGGTIRLSGYPTDAGYCFSVEDWGCGIPEEALDHLTEPFYMVDKSRARADGGAGLGLTLCRSIAALHGSVLSYTSRLGAGTCVAFTLPLQEDSKC